MNRDYARTKLVRILSLPWAGSLLAVVLFFSLCIGLLHPRYAINDDLKIISILAGYPAGNPAPYPVFSNVIVGLLLVPLYRLPTSANWEVLLFVALDLASTWALLYVLFSQQVNGRWKPIAVAIILISAGYFALNITFTNVAGYACFAGLCLLLDSVRRDHSPKSIEAAAAILLVLVGSLVRPEMLVLALPLVVPAAVFLFLSLDLRRLLIVTGCAALAVLAAFGFDRLYVRAHPDWNAYYFYNKSAQQVLDAHRLSNAGSRIKHISWSTNDQEVFARSFFPDERIFSVDRLQYLIERVSATGDKPIASSRLVLQRLLAPSVLPLALLMAALFLLPLTMTISVRRKLAAMSIPFVFLAESFFLAWAYKNPDWVLFTLLAIALMLQALILHWNVTVEDNSAGKALGTAWMRPGRGVILSAIVVLLAIIVIQSVSSSRDNLSRQAAYRQILTDIGQLQAEGRLAPDAIIISPSHGIPWEWSDPLRLELPGIPFLDTGWITFSPSYEGALERFDLDPLPQALFEKANVYVMTKQIFKGYLARYYEEHLHITVTFKTLYTIPGAYRTGEYQDTELYKVILVK